ncbi:hypothetical protein FH972_005739 [Carpinus fangiana]|uniref:GRF-type domain-containing protein n=1 Tax=Carpinus fangiana TaxID=176857 RepID=A0A5N6QTP6_9ROSI|nr:hypothetical protein FH972_005739 [Carpinus fangiana]
MDLEIECSCGAGPMTLLVSRTDRNYMRRFYKCPLFQNHRGSFYWEDELLQNMSTPSADVEELGVHGNSSALDKQWPKTAIRCRFHLVLYALCCLGVALLLILLVA